ncbi:MAG: helix-hairpin-helix domain-containing protein, partial [Candidatus Aenigmatarchaeota archaeon]
LLNRKDKIKHIRKARKRVKNGIKKELLPLIRLREIGRVRARKLYKAGFTSIAKLRDAPVQRLQGIIGNKTAKTVKKQLSDDKTKQTTLD